SKRLLGFRDSDISIVYGIETISIPNEIKDTVSSAIEQGNAVIEAKIDAEGAAKIINFYIDGKLIDFTVNQ
ncbi:MAG: hypothetical protein LBV16_06285, partial [Elusimicrobiota bacterium]|nr:hypothetical protein [Elusimicrobiota bacterium]